MKHRDLRLAALAAAVLCAALLLGALTLRSWPLVVSPLLIVVCIVAMSSEALAFDSSSLHFSITYAVCAATIILFGPSAGALAAGLSTIPPALAETDKKVVRGAFNFGQIVLANLAAGWAYVAAGGRLIANQPLIAAEVPRALVPVALLAVATFAVNTLLVSLAVSIMSGTPVVAAWRSAFLWTMRTEAALTVLALALAETVASEGSIGLALFVVPLLIARQFYERYVILRRAYADTVRSLIAVIEAKDPYTRGHSERVAQYSVDLAERMGLSHQRVERLELAALLHDLGKVAVSRTILSKDSRLTDDEFEAVKKHPEVGATLVGSVPFLADLAPLISSHHERVDGTGYGQQLPGDRLPIEVRILTVADSFDAMTSCRPYRDALSLGDSVCEMRRCVGRQFDGEIVETFVDALQASNALSWSEGRSDDAS
jgi:hypothetical protein